MDLWNIYVLICHRNVSAECCAPLCDNPSSGSADQVCVLYMNVNSTWKDWHILTVYHTKKYWCTECQSQSHAIVTWTNMSIVNVFRKNWLFHIGTILYLLKKKTVYLMKMMASCRARFIKNLLAHLWFFFFKTPHIRFIRKCQNPLAWLVVRLAQAIG